MTTVGNKDDVKDVAWVCLAYYWVPLWIRLFPCGSGMQKQSESPTLLRRS